MEEDEEMRSEKSQRTPSFRLTVAVLLYEWLLPSEFCCQQAGVESPSTERKLRRETALVMPQAVEHSAPSPAGGTAEQAEPVPVPPQT